MGWSGPFLDVGFDKDQAEGNIGVHAFPGRQMVNFWPEGP